MKKTLLFLLFGLLACGAMAKNPNLHDFKQTIGLGINASTGGIGGDVYWTFYPKLTARVGYEMFQFNHNFDFSQDEFDLRAKAKLKTGGITAGVNYQFLNWMYVTGGIYVSNFRPEAKAIPTSSIRFGSGSGIELTPETVGSLSLKIKPAAPVSPYVGLGFGRMAPKRHVSFAFELGTYYMGSPKFDVTATGMLAPSQDPGHVRMLEGQFREYRFYPVVKFHLGVKLFTLKKYK